MVSICIFQLWLIVSLFLFLWSFQWELKRGGVLNELAEIVLNQKSVMIFLDLYLFFYLRVKDADLEAAKIGICNLGKYR